MNDSRPKPSLLISYGGNAINVPDHVHAPQKEEFAIARNSMKQIVELIEEGYHKIILTHGNGPQVGQIFLQQELTRHKFPRKVTLDICVADSQGRIGYILQNVFDNICLEKGMDKRAFAIITQVVVDQNDPAFKHPTKPIGMFYSKRDAEILKTEQGWNLIEDARRGYRRAVPSPMPLEIVEKEIFRENLKHGFIAIGAGGGGIPVIRKSNGELTGVEAVIDKDHTSALLANELAIDQLIILTEVEFAYLNFNSSKPTPIRTVTAKVMEGFLQAGEFAEGSMKPKVEAVLKFLHGGGKKAVIAKLSDLRQAIAGKTGTQIIAD
jgi:carbamate kinase